MWRTIQKFQKRFEFDMSPLYFGIKASWSFFATSHGKSPCDGIGGSVKQKLNNASLAASASQKILSTEAVFNYYSKNMPKITFFNLSKSEVDETRSRIRDCCSKGHTVVGTRSFHHFSSLVQFSSKGFPWIKSLQALIHSIQVRMFMN